MANEYLEYIKKHRLDFVKLTEKQNSELAKLYIKTAEIIKAQAESIIDKQGLTYAAAKIRVKSLLLEADRLTDGFKGILNKSLIDAADLGKEADKIMMSKYQSSLADNGIKVDMTRILQKVNPEAVAAVFDRIYTDGLKLSDRIWLLDRRSKQEIERIILQNVISGGSASNKATLSALENLLNPGYTPAKLTSLHGRKVGYEASRLLRTSMSEAFNEGARLSSSKNPGSTGMKLLIAVGACEICTPLDGLPVEQTGLPPIHPNCRCTTLEDVMSVEKFTDKWIDFMDNPKKYPDMQDWLINVYDKGGAKTLTSMPAAKEAVKDVKQRGHLEEKSLRESIKTIQEDAKSNGIVINEYDATMINNSIKHYSNFGSSKIRAIQTKNLDYFDTKIELDAAKKSAANVEKFIEISPAYTKSDTIYRGITQGRDVYENIPKGAIIDMRGTASFSSDAWKAIEFSGSSDEGLIFDFVGGTNKSASIKYLSSGASENEILLSKEVSYRFTGKKYIDARDHLHMILEEVL